MHLHNMRSLKGASLEGNPALIDKFLTGCLWIPHLVMGYLPIYYPDKRPKKLRIGIGLVCSVTLPNILVELVVFQEMTTLF